MTVFEQLAAPFHPSQIEWRVQSAKVGKRGPYAQVLAYVDNRAIMDRLDKVLGPANWQNTFNMNEQGVICSIGIRNPETDSWIWKSDGAGFTDVESTKGGISGAMKRAAVQLGIGRYLYDIKSNFGIIYDYGRYQGRTSDQSRQDFRWSPPALERFALPEGVPTLEEGLAYLREAYKDIPTSARIRVAKEWFNIRDLLKELTEDMKKDYLLILDIVEEVQRLLA